MPAARRRARRSKGSWLVRLSALGAGLRRALRWSRSARNGLEATQRSQSPLEPVSPRPVDRPAQNRGPGVVDEADGDVDEPLAHGASSDALATRSGPAEGGGPADGIVGQH